MLKVKQFVFNMFGVNTYLVIDPDTKEAAVIDPGMYGSDEQKEFDDYVKANGLKIIEVINILDFILIDIFNDVLTLSFKFLLEAGHVLITMHESILGSNLLQLIAL